MDTDKKWRISELNHLKQEEFIRVIGPVFEHSPWIAEATWTKRPFANLEELHASLCETVAQLDESKKLNLLRAHPDLVGRTALAATLTSASTREQASAGLDRLTPQEIALFQQHNREYWKKFGFPFVICARLNKKEAILAGFTPRLQHSCAEEIETALVEIGKIAWLRLQDLIKI